MSKLSALQRAVEKDGIVLEPGPGALMSVVLEHEGARARVCTHGAHVLSYEPRDQVPVLWLSPAAIFQPAQPIRGGIPICWPWFGDHPDDTGLPAHGFARTAEWALVDSVSNDDEKAVTLALHDTARTRAMWPHAFSLRYRVSVSERLRASLSVTNTGSESMRVTEALHSYFKVLDVDRVLLEGLAGCRYLDKVENYKDKLQSEALLGFASETDRVYLDTGQACTIHDAALGRQIRIRKAGSRSTVVWNPWQRRARQLVDFPDDGYQSMLCVETANAASDGIDLAPGASHMLQVCIESVVGG